MIGLVDFSGVYFLDSLSDISCVNTGAGFDRTYGHLILSQLNHVRILKIVQIDRRLVESPVYLTY